MNKFAVTGILRTFSKQELKEFDKVVRSPYFGGSAYINKFWRELRKYYPEFKEDKVEREKLFKKIYPGKKYDDTVIRKIASLLHKMAEQYIGLKRANTDTAWFIELFTAVSLRERRLNRLFELKAGELEKRFDDLSVYDFQRLLERHILQIQWMNYATDNNNSHKNFEYRMTYYRYGIIYFLSILMQETARTWVEKNIYNNSAKFNIAEEMLSHIDLNSFAAVLEKQNFSYMPTFEVNRLMMNMYRAEEGHVNFFNYRDFLFAKGADMPRRVCYFYFIFLINYCLKHSQSNEYDFTSELSNVIEKADEFGIILDPQLKIIIPANFLVGMEAHIDANQFARAEKFFKKYSGELKGEYSEDTINYTHASLELARGNYRSALEFIYKHDPFLVYNKVNFRILKLIALYELNLWEEFGLLVDSTRQFVRSTDLISNVFRQRALDFLNAANRLFEAREKNSGNVVNIYESVNGNEDLIQRKWLLKKCSEIL